MVYHQRFKTTEARWAEKFSAPKRGCWEWRSGDSREYPKFWVGGRYVRASHYAFELAGGRVLPGTCVCHRCDNPKCVRPDHLFLGTHDDNMTDKAKKRRAHRPKGSLNGRAKLGKLAADEIRERYALGGVSQQSLANEFGVSQQIVSGVIRGIYWI